MTVTHGTGAVFATRWTPEAGGPFPLRLVEGQETRRIELLRDAKVEVYTSARSFLTALHGPGYAARHWTLDRYLRRSVIEGPEPSITIVGPMMPAQFERAGIIVGPSLPRRALVSKQAVRGIDLDTRSHEVAKLLHAGFNSWIHNSGYDFEDVLHEVYRKILVSNAGTKPWDPAKSSFGHYVHMVCRSALSNYHRKVARVATKEQVGIYTRKADGTWAPTDAREAGVAKPGTGRDAALDPAEDLKRYMAASPMGKRPEALLAQRLLPLVQAGYTLKDAALALGVDRPTIGKAMSFLRLSATRWAR